MHLDFGYFGGRKQIYVTQYKAMDRDRAFDNLHTTAATTENRKPDTTHNTPPGQQDSPLKSSKSDSDYGSRDSLVEEPGQNSVTPLLPRRSLKKGDEGNKVQQQNARPTNLGYPLESLSRQVSTESHAALSVRQGSKRKFTVLNYGQTSIDDCPPTPLSPTLSITTSQNSIVHPEIISTLKHKHEQQKQANIDLLLERKINISSPNQIKSVEPVLERRISIPTTPTDPPKKVSFDPQLKFDDSKTDSVNSGSISKSLALVEILRRGRLFAKRKQKRLVFKNGEINFSNKNVEKKSLSYFLDMFTTLLDLKWRYIVFIFVMAFLGSWLIFGLIWWGFVLAGTNSETSCLDNVNDFSTALLFSVETQQTIGYGGRAVTSQCPLAIGLMMLQSLLGVLLSCVMTGLIFAKFSRPKRRAETILFSKSAVICERDGERCLVFRVGDMRRTHMATVSIRAMLIRKHITTEKEEIPFFQHNLHVQTESEDFFFLAWPIKVVHKIDKNSPLWQMSCEDLLAADFEIVVVLEGTNQTTGQTTQVRTSYLPGEIMWGHRLNSLITSLKYNNKYQVDYTRFHDTVPVNMGETSAQQFELKKRREAKI